MAKLNKLDGVLAQQEQLDAAGIAIRCAFRGWRYAPDCGALARACACRPDPDSKVAQRALERATASSAQAQVDALTAILADVSALARRGPRSAPPAARS